VSRRTALVVVVSACSAVASVVMVPTAAHAARTCRVDSNVTAAQVIVVRATGTYATIKACRRVSPGTYVVVHGPYSARVGRNGVALPGTKREGDGRTPGGVWPLRSGFGVRSDPGVRFAWLHVDSRDVWVDDSASAFYNLHERTPVNGRWRSAEKLKTSPAYDYAQVIGYNEKRTRGRGSAIFLHVDAGRATAGCVAVPRSALLTLLRWERAGAVISIRHT